MSTFISTDASARRLDTFASKPSSQRNDDIVEVSLLLPSQWANDLMELSRERGESVGQILRSMIGQALHDGPGC
jgi:hypothetical protein